MKIAQVAPLYESVPPKTYGGTERIASYLTEELVDQGHDVTLFASGDSVTAARLVPCCPQALRFDKQCIDSLAHHMVMLERVFREANHFDVMHFHCDYLHFPCSRCHKTPNVTTLHGRLDLPDLVPLYREFPEMPVVSISNDQRSPLPGLNWQGTVYHGLPRNLYSFHGGPGQYLAFLGRICPEKGVDRAIEIAKESGLELRIAAKVDRVDKEYFKNAIQPLLADPLIQFVGEINEQDKNTFLGGALALLAPVRWPEPFGLVLIEAMAAGTPIIAFEEGSIPELVENGRSGFVVKTTKQAVAAVQSIGRIRREECRRIFEERFTASRMAQDYMRIYEGLIRAQSDPEAPALRRPVAV